MKKIRSIAANILVGFGLFSSAYTVSQLFSGIWMILATIVLGVVIVLTIAGETPGE